MTLIMWEQAIDRVVVFTDTLVSDGRPPHVPLGFTTKIQLMPHLNLGIATTGNTALLGAWCNWITYNVLDAESIDDLLRPAAATLPRLQEELTDTPVFQTLYGDMSKDEWRLGCVYHFGIDADGRAVSHWFRWEDDFAPEVHCEEMPMQFVAPDLHNDRGTFTNTAEAVQLACDLKGCGMMPGIGGELYRTVLRDGQISHQRVHVFDDHDEVAETIRRDVPGYLQSLVEEVGL